ncbi:prenyltransferase [Nocardia sp. NPDC050175]|uniref:prenyltransferase n=1 Tax=Nocardia sp. NPDC050175 TaxID=3364317 RepID=UPI00378DBE0F
MVTTDKLEVVAVPVGWAWLRAFIRLGRPKFLLQSAAAVGLGMTVAAYDGHPLHPVWYVFALLGAWISHLMVHYCNEYFDLDADRKNVEHTQWTGGSRVLVEGLVKPETSLGTAFLLGFLAFFILAAVPDLLVRELGVLLVALAWFYTAPPIRLNYRGLGELTTGICLYGLAPLCYRLQAGTWSTMLFAIVVPILFIQMLRQFLMNLSDIEGDRLADKRTIAVIVGPRIVIRLYIGGQIACYTLILALGVSGALPLPVCFAMLLTCPLPIWVGRQLLTEAMRVPRRANLVTFLASMQLPAIVCAAMSGLVVDTLQGGGHGLASWVPVYAATVFICCAWVVGWLLARPRIA